MPDTIDHHGLNDIEMVSEVDKDGVVTHRANGVGNHEYLLMIPGHTKEGRDAIYLNPNEVVKNLTNEENAKAVDDEFLFGFPHIPYPGDIYVNHKQGKTTPVVSVNDQWVFLGNGERLNQKKPGDSSEWSHQHLI